MNNFPPAASVCPNGVVDLASFRKQKQEKAALSQGKTLLPPSEHIAEIWANLNKIALQISELKAQTAEEDPKA